MAKQQRQPKWLNSDTKALFDVIYELKNGDEIKRFFRDLLTEGEIAEFAKRWKAAKLLARKVPYVKIEQETGLSSTTIARVHKWLTKGMGGYKLMIKKMKI